MVVAWHDRFDASPGVGKATGKCVGGTASQLANGVKANPVSGNAAGHHFLRLKSHSENGILVIESVQSDLIDFLEFKMDEMVVERGCRITLCLSPFQGMDHKSDARIGYFAEENPISIQRQKAYFRVVEQGPVSECFDDPLVINEMNWSRKRAHTWAILPQSPVAGANDRRAPAASSLRPSERPGAGRMDRDGRAP